MTDRELLELAAKAAGYPTSLRVDGLEIEWNGRWVFWDPLTDDGDALRLSVQLRIAIEHAGHVHKGRGGCDRVQASPRGLGHMADVLMYDGDPLAATRRAIVSVAAEIGKAMP